MTDNNKNLLSADQKQKMTKYAVFALMGIICAGAIFYIFSPSADEKAKQEAQLGFNTDIPMPKEESIIGDKRNAYEQEQIKQRQEERMRSLQDFSSILGDNAPKQTVDLELMTDDNAPRAVGGYTSRSQSSIQSSAVVYNDINRTLGSFYEKPREDAEKERLREELEEMKLRIEETENRKNSIDEQLELMERSFQMAAKYMPAGTATTAVPQGITTESATQVSNNVSGKTSAAPVSQVRESAVSALLPEMSNAEFIKTYSQVRNMSFLTAVSQAGEGTKNTISACVHSDQTIMDGQNVRLRLLEPVQASNLDVPRGAVISGMARFQGERLGITVVSLEHGGTVVPVELRVFDMDGQSGIFIPNLQELNAVKEIVANMGTNAGTSINLSNDAGKQFAADMGRNVIQGVSQFTAKKLREVKVHLKSGYRVYLMSDGNNKQ